MEIQVPQGERVRNLEAAYLAALQALLGTDLPARVLVISL